LQSAEIAAADQARTTGQPVPVDAATDAYSTLTAQPDGSFTRDVSASPQRVQQNSTWIPLDPTLHRNDDGTYSTNATTAALTLSGGGTGPLAAMDDAGKKLAFSWPTSLPAPTVTGSTALYADVLPDVDLSVQANDQGGFTDIIIVKTAQAAQNPALSTLNLSTASAGVTLAADAAGNLSATDDSGTLIFHSPAPVMWDSSTSSASTTQKTAESPARRTSSADSTASADGPLPGAQVASVAVQVQTGSVKLTPDAGLLNGSGTTYPVYIDPAYTPTWVDGSTASADYTYIQSGHPDASNWDANTSYDSKGIGVGYQGYQSPIGVERSFYQFNVGTWIDTKTIHSATLKVDETYTASWGCETYDVKAYSMASHIDSSSTWSNFHGRTATYLDTQAVGGAYNSGCAGVFHSNFDVTSALNSDGDGVLTLELVGNEGNRDAFKRFAKTATLSYQYNSIPAVPTGPTARPTPQTAPGATTQGCTSGGPWGWISRGGSGGSITLSAKVSDPDSGHGQLVRGQFALWDGSTSGGATSIISMGYPADPSAGTLDSSGAWITSGDTATKTVPVSRLTDGHTYGWQVRSDDGINHAAATDVCHFRYDASAPTAVSVNGQGTTSGSCTDGGTVAMTGSPESFTLTATDNESGLDHFDWTLGAASDLSGDGGRHTNPVTFTPKGWGTYFLNVAAVDKAGNQSGAVCYSFYVPDNPAAGVTPGDIDGDGYRDFAAIPNNTYTGTLTGLRYYPTNTANAAGRQASDNSNGPNADGTWNGALVAHRSTPQRSASGTKTDDLWALGTNDLLYLYTNNINSNAAVPPYYTADRRTQVARPHCNSAITTCTQYKPGWTDVKQLIAVGDMNDDGIPDLVTAEAGNLLWFFPGESTSGALGNPQLIGSGGWDTYTVVAPGNTPGDNGLAALWSRDNATGTLYQYLTSLDSATGKITLQPRAQIGTGFTSDSYPLIISVGDISGDNAPDLIATTSDGTLVDQLGTTTSSSTEFDGTPGKVAQIGDAGWNSIATIN
jgi:hypothetical protein